MAFKWAGVADAEKILEAAFDAPVLLEAFQLADDLVDALVGIPTAATGVEGDDVDEHLALVGESFQVVQTFVGGGPLEDGAVGVDEREAVTSVGIGMIEDVGQVEVAVQDTLLVQLHEESCQCVGQRMVEVRHREEDARRRIVAVERHEEAGGEEPVAPGLDVRHLVGRLDALVAQQGGELIGTLGLRALEVGVDDALEEVGVLVFLDDERLSVHPVAFDDVTSLIQQFATLVESGRQLPDEVAVAAVVGMDDKFHVSLSLIRLVA